MVTSEEINYLVYRYLQEAGFLHSSFVFGHESLVRHGPAHVDTVPTGALVQLIHKGLHYMEIEAHLRDDGTQKSCRRPFSILKPHVCDDSGDLVGNDEKPHKRDKTPEFREISTDHVQTLDGHSDQVFVCQWNPIQPVLASASADGCTILWSMDTGGDPVTLDQRNGSAVDITTIDWNRAGTQLATGDYNGLACVWNADGQLVHRLKGHSEPIFVLRWNKRGNHLLTGGCDSAVILWDTALGEIKQTFGFHTGPVFDLCWKNNTTFASCSGDRLIRLCKLHEKRPIRTFAGHTGDINAIRWDPSRRYLASGSDDGLVKIWPVHGSEGPLYSLIGHEKQVYCLDWNPSGPRSDNGGLSVQLASGSFDGSVRVWDVGTGQCIHILSRHQSHVYTIGYSPDAQFIATGSADKTVHIWSARDGQLVRTFTGVGSCVYDIGWNSTSDEIAICSQNSSLQVIDLGWE